MMGQHGRRRDSDESESSAQRRRTGLWRRSIAACALALTLGLGQAATDHAYADTIANAHEGGQGRDKSNPSSIASAGAFAGEGGADASPAGSSEAFGGFQRAIAKRDLRARANAPTQVVTVDVEEDGVGTAAWTRTVTRTITNLARVTSVTRSFSYAADEEGNQAIAKAVARASAPNNVGAVRNGVSRGGVKVSTWGETSAEVF